MSDASRLEWITGNRNHHWTRGPAHAGWAQVVVGLEAREQFGYGLVDLAACARPLGGETVEWLPWLTANGDHQRESRPFVAPAGHVLAGLKVREQPGYGVIDVSCLYRRDEDVPDPVFLEAGWLCGNPDGEVLVSRAPPNAFVVGIEAREQAGYGIVDLRLRVVPAPLVRAARHAMDRERLEAARRVLADAPPAAEA